MNHKLQLNIDRTLAVSIREQICNQIHQMVKSEELQVGDKLPTLKELVKQSSVGICTIREAFGQLERDGIIVKKPRLGTFISSDSTRVMAQVIDVSSEAKFRLKNLCVGLVIEDACLKNRQIMNIVEEFESQVSHVGGKTVIVTFTRRFL